MVARNTESFGAPEGHPVVTEALRYKKKILTLETAATSNPSWLRSCGLLNCYTTVAPGDFVKGLGVGVGSPASMVSKTEQTCVGICLVPGGIEKSSPGAIWHK